MGPALQHSPAPARRLHQPQNHLHRRGNRGRTSRATASTGQGRRPRPAQRIRRRQPLPLPGLPLQRASPSAPRSSETESRNSNYDLGGVLLNRAHSRRPMTLTSTPPSRLYRPPEHGISTRQTAPARRNAIELEQAPLTKVKLLRGRYADEPPERVGSPRTTRRDLLRPDKPSTRESARLPVPLLPAKPQSERRPGALSGHGDRLGSSPTREPDPATSSSTPSLSHS